MWATIRFQKVEKEWLFFLEYLIKKVPKIKLTLNRINGIIVTNIKVAQNN